MPLGGLEKEASPIPFEAGSQQKDTSSFNVSTERLAQESQKARDALLLGGRRLKDITDEFASASSRLSPGQLIKDEDFTLFEAVGALEIMDPKMDSGYVAPDDTFESDFDPSCDLDATEILWIIDQLLCLEITWHDGYPLSQTVFTSLHIDRLLSPDQDSSYLLHFSDGSGTAARSLTHKILRPYCVGLIKCCQSALHLIQSQNFYEEEDFVTHLFGRELLPKLGTDAASSLLNEALDALAGFELSAEVDDALASRLQARQALLQTLAGDENHWQFVLETTDRVRLSHHLARPTPQAFSDKVQRKLATSTPPRPMLQISWDEACKKWTKLCEDVLAARQVTSWHIVQSPHSLQRAIWAFAYRGQPYPLARAYLQDVLFGNQTIGDSDVSQYDLLLTDIRDLVLAGDPLADPQSFQVEMTTDPRHKRSRVIEGFLDKAIDEYLNLYRMVCQNRCRIRRTFTQAIPILDALESEAGRVDEELLKVTTSLRLPDNRPFYTLSSWAKYYKLRVMSWTIQLGIETEIYLPDELGSMYWLLAHLSGQLTMLFRYIEMSMSGRIQHPKDRNNAAECLAALDYYESQRNVSESTRLISEALSKFYRLLKHLRIISTPKRDCALDPRLLYELRMKPYLSIRNDPIPSSEEFDSAMKQVQSVEDTCKAIDQHIKDARALLGKLKQTTPEQGSHIGTEEQWKAEIKATETTCVAIVVANSQLLRAFRKQGDADLQKYLTCSVEKKYHDWWIVPVLKDR